MEVEGICSSLKMNRTYKGCDVGLCLGTESASRLPITCYMYSTTPGKSVAGCEFSLALTTSLSQQLACAFPQGGYLPWWAKLQPILVQTRREKLVFPPERRTDWLLAGLQVGTRNLQNWYRLNDNNTPLTAGFLQQLFLRHSK